MCLYIILIVSSRKGEYMGGYQGKLGLLGIVFHQEGIITSLRKTFNKLIVRYNIFSCNRHNSDKGIIIGYWSIHVTKLINKMCVCILYRSFLWKQLKQCNEMGLNALLTSVPYRGHPPGAVKTGRPNPGTACFLALTPSGDLCACGTRNAGKRAALTSSFYL